MPSIDLKNFWSLKTNYFLVSQFIPFPIDVDPANLPSFDIHQANIILSNNDPNMAHYLATLLTDTSDSVNKMYEIFYILLYFLCQSINFFLYYSNKWITKLIMLWKIINLEQARHLILVIYIYLFCQIAPFLLNFRFFKIFYWSGIVKWLYFEWYYDRKLLIFFSELKNSEREMNDSSPSPLLPLFQAILRISPFAFQSTSSFPLVDTMSSKELNKNTQVDFSYMSSPIITIILVRNRYFDSYRNSNIFTI